MMTLDEFEVFRARVFLYTTGANIHRINNLLYLMHSSLELLARCDNPQCASCLEYLQNVIDGERAIRCLLPLLRE
jgi:hypothetical protein